MKFKNEHLMMAVMTALALFVGCQPELKPDNKGVEVVIENGGSFPKELAGRWEARDDSGWEIYFEKDGRISFARVEFAKAEMRPGEVTEYPTRYGGKGIFEPGKWSVYYAPERCELTVNIAVKHFYQDIAKDAVEGSIEYILIGWVSEDDSRWTADCYAKYNITALMPEPIILENMDEPNFKATVVLEKVD